MIPEPSFFDWNFLVRAYDDLQFQSIINYNLSFNNILPHVSQNQKKLLKIVESIQGYFK